MQTASLAALACLLPLLGASGPARAAPATFVSGAGSNSNDCRTPESPCREIGGTNAALSKTDPGGTIHVAIGSYRAFTVPDISVNIIADVGLASIGNDSVPIPGGGRAAIVANVGSSAVIRIRGFVIDNGAGSIAAVGDGSLHVEDCVLVPGGGGRGVAFRPNGRSELYVSDTIISRPADAISGAGLGIEITPAGEGTGSMVLDNVRVEGNLTGLRVDGRATTGTISVVVRNSLIFGSAANGLVAFDGGDGATTVEVEGSTLSDNAARGLVASGVNVTVRMRDSTVTGNKDGLAVALGAQIISQGGNVVAGNSSNGTFTSSLPQQ